MTDEEKVNIKYRLSDIGEQIGSLALEYIADLEKENAELKDKLEHGKQLDFNISIGNERFIKRIEQLEKENAELKKEISVLLSCANCSENKGGYVCEKEYNDKCLAQKIEYIKELKEQIEKMKCCGNCKHKNDSNTDYYCEDCKRFANETDIDKWELAE